VPIAGARRGGSSRPRGADADADGDGLTAAELANLADGTANAYRKKTLAGFDYALRKLRWFCSHSHESEAAVAFLKSIGVDEPRGFNYNLVGDEGVALAVRAIKWAGANFPGWHAWKARQGVGAGRPAPASATWGTLEAFLSAMQALYAFQSITAPGAGGAPRHRRLGEHSLVAAAIKQVKHEVGSRRGVDIYADADPQDGGGADYTIEDLQIIAKSLLDSAAPDDARNLALILAGHASVARGDDLRQLRMCSVKAPVSVTCVGPSPANVVSVMIHAGKAQALNSTDLKLLVRHRDVLLDPQGALARQLATDFVLNNIPFPDLLDAVSWRKAILFRGKNLNLEVTPDAHRAIINKACADAGVPPFGTHAGCRGGARYLDAQGVGKEAIERAGNWVQSAGDMQRSYLVNWNPQLVVALAGFRGAAEHNYNLHFEPRFSVGVPEDLVDFYYPFLPGLRARLAAERESGRKVPTSAASMLALLEYLARVGVQDALDIVELYYDSETEARNPVLARLMAHASFEELRQQYSAMQAAGAFELMRPKTTSEAVRNLGALLGDLAAQLRGRGGGEAVAAQVAYMASVSPGGGAGIVGEAALNRHRQELERRARERAAEAGGAEGDVVSEQLGRFLTSPERRRREAAGAGALAGGELGRRLDFGAPAAAGAPGQPALEAELARVRAARLERAYDVALAEREAHLLRLLAAGASPPAVGASPPAWLPQPPPFVQGGGAALPPPGFYGAAGSAAGGAPPPGFYGAAGSARGVPPGLYGTLAGLAPPGAPGWLHAPGFVALPPPPAAGAGPAWLGLGGARLFGGGAGAGAGAGIFGADFGASPLLGAAGAALPVAPASQGGAADRTPAAAALHALGNASSSFRPNGPRHPVTTWERAAARAAARLRYAPGRP
jgi:hypothetical protein